MSLQPNVCDFCKKRKLKCSRETPTCDKCVKYKRICVYSSKYRKVSLTKANFMYLKRKSNALEKALCGLINDKHELDQILRQIELEAVGEEGELEENNNSDNNNNSNRRGRTITKGSLNGDPLSSSDNIYHPTGDEHHHTISDYIKEDEYLLNEIEEIEDMVWYEPDNDYEINELTSTQITDLMGGLTVGTNDNLKIPLYYGISSPNGIIKFLKESDANAKKILENFKPITTDIDYKTNLVLVKQVYGDFFLDNPEFHRHLFDSYFCIYHKCYPILEKGSFLKDYHSLPTKVGMSKKCLKILIYTVLSIGSFCKYGDNSVIDLLYYKRVKQELKTADIMEYNSFYLLEALTLLGNYCQKRNKPNTGFNYHGICFRMAISFGLHREISNYNSSATIPTPDNITQEYKQPVNYERVSGILERRRRVFWGLYILDIGHCITLGRPSLGPLLETINVKYPSIDFDQEHEESGYSHHINPSIIEGFVLEGKLLKISTRINNVITRLDDTIMERIKSLKHLNEEINKFSEEMPYYFKDESEVRVPPWFLFRRVKIVWRYKNMKILMFRNFIWQLNKNRMSGSNKKLSESKDAILQKLINECIKICLKESFETIDSISNFIRGNELNHFTAWYPIYFIYHAVLVPILLINNQEVQSEISNDVQEFNDLNKFHHYIKLSQETLLSLKKYNNNITCNLINLIEILSVNLKDNFLLINEIFNKDLNELNFEFDGGLDPQNTEEIPDLSPFNFDIDNSYFA